jgi:hypothetical protein
MVTSVHLPPSHVKFVVTTLVYRFLRLACLLREFYSLQTGQIGLSGIYPRGVPKISNLYGCILPLHLAIQAFREIFFERSGISNGDIIPFFTINFGGKFLC